MRLWYICIALSISACGFKPMLATHDVSGNTSASPSSPSLQHAFARIDIPPIGNQRIGQILHHTLEDHFYAQGRETPEYILNIKLDTLTSPIAISRDGTIARYSVELKATLQLVALENSQLLYSGEVRHLSSFNNQANNFYSAHISERYALERGAIELAEDIRLRLSNVLFKQNTP